MPEISNSITQKYINKKNNCNYDHVVKEENKVLCSMCENNVTTNNAFIPMECLIRWGDRLSHRICTHCWWNPIIGFAIELGSHKCPGCVKGLPLSSNKNIVPTLIDLSID